MKIAIAIPGPTDTVPGSYAFDLAMLAGHLIAEVPELTLRLIASANPVPDGQDPRIEAANAWGADVAVVLPTDERFPAHALDLLIARVAEIKDPLVKVVRN